MAARRQSFWPWIGRYQADGACRQIYARVGRGAVAVFDVESNEALHRILNEWADIIPAEFEVYPLVDVEATHKMLAAQVAANPDDHAKRFELAGGLMAAGDRDAAADHLLDIIRADRDWNDGAAKAQLLKLFDVVGVMDPWVAAQRRRLSAVLFT